MWQCNTLVRYLTSWLTGSRNCIPLQQQESVVPCMVNLGKDQNLKHGFHIPLWNPKFESWTILIQGPCTDLQGVGTGKNREQLLIGTRFLFGVKYSKTHCGNGCKLYDHTKKNYWIVQVKWIDCLVCKLYLNKKAEKKCRRPPYLWVIRSIIHW